MIKLLYMSADDAPCEIPSDISEYRKNKIISAKTDSAKRVLIAAAEALKAGFSAFGIEEKNVVYKILENGKPYALSHSEIHFSLSHSENMAVAVFSDSPVGVDCERWDRKVSPELIKRFFSAEEAEDYKDNPLLLWVARESISKLSGDGVFSGNKRTRIPVFKENTAVSGKVTLEKLLVNDNLVVVAAENREAPGGKPFLKSVDIRDVGNNRKIS